MQHGNLKRNSRKRGPEVWQFRWSENSPEGKRLHHKKPRASLSTSTIFSPLDKPGGH
jgi:hypothetical protein